MDKITIFFSEICLYIVNFCPVFDDGFPYNNYKPTDNFFNGRDMRALLTYHYQERR